MFQKMLHTELPVWYITFLGILGFSPSALLLQTSELRCYQCVAFNCTNELTICHSAQEFVRKQLPLFYYIKEGFPVCPDPYSTDDWERMKNTYPSSTPCQQIKDGEATCTLGRFRVITHITESNVNLTSYGTVLGCAGRELLTRIKNTLIDRSAKEDTLHSLRKCHSDEILSPVRNSLRHIFELEHCSTFSDMCHEEKFCIEPQLSEVKSFKEIEYDTYVPISMFIWIGIALAVLITIVSFLGIRYG